MENLNLHLDVTGQTAEALTIISGITGRSPAEIASRVLDGIAGYIDYPLELRAHCQGVAESPDDLDAMETRLRAYCERQGLPYIEQTGHAVTAR